MSNGLILNTDVRGRPPGELWRPDRDPSVVRLRAGAYVHVDEWDAARPSEKYRLAVLAAEETARSRRVYSHESAAAVLRLPMLGRLPRTIHVTQHLGPGGRSSGLVTRHGVRRMPATVEVDGLLVTSPARTVVDLARTRTFTSALVAADFVLANGLCTPEELAAEVELLGRSRGARAASYVVERADGRAESPGESLSRGRMYELEAAIPELQVGFSDDEGFIGRVDFWWPALGLVGEFDGRSKYRAGSGSGPPEDVVWDEKLREDRLRRRVSGVLRWTWDIAYDERRFRRLLAGAGLM